MKKILCMLLMAAPFMVAAQKEIKPNVNKAEKALNEGKIDEAKAIIDVTVASQEFMVDKKGQPSKNAAKAWYLKGIIYAAIDTTKAEKFKSLEANPFDVAKEAFEKSKEIDKGETPSFVKDKDGFLPLMNDQVNAKLAQSYLTKSLAAYQDEKNYKKAFVEMERVVYFVPNDTTMLLNAGVYFGPSAEEYDKSIDYINKYIGKGGKNTDAYIQLFSIYRDKKKDHEMALATAKKMIEVYPNNKEFPKYELDMYVKMGRLPDAKALMEKQASADPSDKESRFFLGVISSELKDDVEARKWFDEAVKIDPDYYDAYASIADMEYKAVKKLREQRNDITGTKDADLKKRSELFQQIKAKLVEALPFWEKLETLKPSEESVLYGLLTIYGDLSTYDEVAYEPKIKKLKSKMKSLSLEVD